MLGRKKKQTNGAKHIASYYAKYIGYLGTNKMIPSEQEIILHIFEEGIYIAFPNLKGDLKGTHIEIPYNVMTDIRNIDGGSKVDFDRVMVAGVLGALWKKHHVITLIEYNDENKTEPQRIALDLGDGIQRVQPMIYQRMQRSNIGT